jgi:hypothetical protein
MALHRDIYWVGRQWAVTGAGIQAVDQKRRHVFDIEVAGIWDDGVAERMHAQAWLNGEDFEQALAIARTRFPAPPRASLPLVESVLELMQPAPVELPKPVAPPAESIRQPNKAQPVTPPEPSPLPAPPLPHLRTEGALARFLPQWRIRR